MSRDLQCLDSTPINSPELWSLQQQPSDSRLNVRSPMLHKRLVGYFSNLILQ